MDHNQNSQQFDFRTLAEGRAAWSVCQAEPVASGEYGSQVMSPACGKINGSKEGTIEGSQGSVTLNLSQKVYLSWQSWILFRASIRVSVLLQLCFNCLQTHIGYSRLISIGHSQNEAIAITDSNREETNKKDIFKDI